VSIAVARHGIGGAAVTDDVGHATWHSLHPGRYAVRVQTMDGPVPASQMRGDVVIATRDGSPAAFALVIERAANTVAGIVRCSDHTPAADALVDVRTHGGVTHVATDERGRFEVTELPRGFRYRLTARHATCGVGSMIVTSSDPVLLVLDPDAPLVVEAPADGRAVLRGPTVVSSAVRRGSHRFEVKPGSYTIEYTTEQGYASAHIDVPPMGTTLELDLEPWSKATGQLRDATGAPLAGWIVLAGDRRQRARQLSRLLRGHGNVTSSDGSFQLRNLRQGTQALQFISPTGQGELNTSIDVHRQLVRLDPVYAPTGHLD